MKLFFSFIISVFLLFSLSFGRWNSTNNKIALKSQAQTQGITPIIVTSYTFDPGIYNILYWVKSMDEVYASQPAARTNLALLFNILKHTYSENITLSQFQTYLISANTGTPLHMMLVNEAGTMLDAGPLDLSLPSQLCGDSSYSGDTIDLLTGGAVLNIGGACNQMIESRAITLNALKAYKISNPTTPTSGGGGSSSTTSGTGSTSSTTSTLPQECPSLSTKAFDYGAAYEDNISQDAANAVHFPTHPQFHKVRIGTAVDGNEFSRRDYDQNTRTPDQDGLNFVVSNNTLLEFDIFNIKGDAPLRELSAPKLTKTPTVFLPNNAFGTVIIYRYERRGAEIFEFKVIDAYAVRNTGTVQVSLNPADFEEDGWLGIIYTSADVQDYGFTLQDITGNPFDLTNKPGWDGFHFSLMNIIMRTTITDPFDPSLPDGEIEEYRYCNKGGKFNYYLPKGPDFQDYLNQCHPSIPSGSSTSSTGNSGGSGNTGATTGTSGTNGGSTNPLPQASLAFSDLLSNMMDQFRQSNSTPETRLRLIFSFFNAILPQL